MGWEMTGDSGESKTDARDKVFQSSLRDYFERLGPTGLSYFLSEVDPENFEESLRGMITRYPEIPTLRVIYAKHLMETGKPAAAIEQLRRALKRDESLAEARLFLIQSLAMIGRFDEAAEYCRAFLKRDPEDPYCNFYMGMIWDRLMHPDDSRYLQKAVALASTENDPEEVLENFAYFAGAVGFSSHEQWVYQKWAEMQPDNYTPLNQFGLMMESNGNLDESVALYERSLEVEPENPWTYLSLAEVYRSKGEHDKALSTCTRCIEIISEEASEESMVALREVSHLMKGLD
ncbi:MAG: tetratricopeptide repeat protein [Thermoplasmata archaeon]|nr:tetratricopeptide repeat protein [Thermoplasmata archaeon]